MAHRESALTVQEKEMIEKLNHPGYTVDYMEHYLNLERIADRDEATKVLMCKVYLEAVQQMLKMSGESGA